jgi:oligoendopeptidase F
LQKYEGIKEKNNFSKKPYSYSFSRIPISVPHFYAGNFYVYKYAIGQIVAIYAAFNIFEKNNDMIGKYYKFLGSGSSRSPINTIKLLGIDLYQPYIYEYVFKKVNKLISDFSQIM